MKKILIFCLLFFAYISLLCAEPLKIVSSFSILGDWVREIGGNKVQVIDLVGFNQDPRYYEISARDQMALEDADIIFIQGLHFESEQLLHTIQYHSNKTSRVSEVFTPEDLMPLIRYNINNIEKQGVNDNKTQLFDPHTWHNVALVKKSIQAIYRQLIKKNPSNWKYYNRRYRDYLAKLGELEQWSQEKFANVDVKNNPLITVHTGFRYLASFYGLDYLSLEANHRHGEISAKQVSEVMRKITQKNAKYIFAGKDSDLKIAKLISKQTNTTVIEELYSNFLTDSEGEAPNYIELMKHNINKITSYLTER